MRRRPRFALVEPVERRWLQHAAIACLLAGGVLWVVLFVVLLQPFPVAAAVNQHWVTPTHFQPMHVTATPFQPLLDEPPIPGIIATPVEDVFFSDWIQQGETAIEIRIAPQHPGWVGSPLVQVRFYPGSECDYGDEHGCASLHHSGQQVLFTVHSGWGGEGEALRHALEGSGIDRARFSLAKTHQLLEALRGAQVEMRRGDQRLADWIVAAAIRIPPQGMSAYFTTPFSLALNQLAEQDPYLFEVLESGQRAVFLETCGWRNPQETTSDLISATSGSIYLIAIIPSR